MAYLDRIVKIYQNEDNDCINEYSLETVKTAALYMFYHYFNADVTKLDELNNQFCFLTGDIADIIAINLNYYEENTIDFLTVLPASVMTNITKIDFSKLYPSFLKKVNEVVANVICRNETDQNLKILNKLDEYTIDDNTVYNVIILCNYPVPIEKKLWYQDVANKYKVNNDKIRFSVVFEDDILEEVSDVESPKEYVSYGEFKLFNSDNISFFGEEKSFLSFISAKSLQKNYYLHSTKGLFASNLRYYVKSAKIDSQITNTIINEPENFCYYNNGIIITCDDYRIKGDKLYLKNFSIVNGGQTTNLIGRSYFENDFSVMCKIIKNKYDNLEDKVEFLSKVAEASNTQKPIKAKDLIANRREQRLLKIQFEKANMFLQIKRGEKIPKDIYPEPWQNATNDQVAQMLASLVYQIPGSAKNSKSKLLENDKTYNKLFKPEYNSSLFVSLQHIRVGFYNWVKILKKTEKYGSYKLGLAKNGDLYTFGIIGLIYKLLVNQQLLDRMKEFDNTEINNENDEIKYILGQNDIGELNLLNNDLILNIGKSTLYSLFNFVYDEILIPSYEKFKRFYPNYAYSNFVKSDLYYYNFVVPESFNALLVNINSFNFADFFDLSKSSCVIIDKYSSFDEYKPGLEEELLEYRSRTYKALGIRAYEVLKNNQISCIMRYRPKTLEDLKVLGKLSNYQCQKFGEPILKIINKYCNVKEYLSGDVNYDKK